MDLAFYLPRLHERMPLAGQPPVRGRGAADAGHALGSSGGAPGDMPVVCGRLCPLLAVGWFALMQEYFVYSEAGHGGLQQPTIA